MISAHVVPHDLAPYTMTFLRTSKDYITYPDTLRKERYFDQWRSSLTTLSTDDWIEVIIRTAEVGGVPCKETKVLSKFQVFTVSFLINWSNQLHKWTSQESTTFYVSFSTQSNNRTRSPRLVIFVIIRGSLLSWPKSGIKNKEYCDHLNDSTKVCGTHRNPKQNKN